MGFIFDALTAGSCRPMIDQTCQMERIVDASRCVETGARVGNAVLVIGRDQADGG